MDDVLDVGRKALDLGGDAVIAAHPDHDQQVRAVDRLVGVAGAHEANHLQRQGVAQRVGAGPQQRPSNGDVGLVGELDQLLLGARYEDSAAAQDHGALRRLDQVRHLPELQHVAPVDRVVGAQAHRLLRVGELDRGLLDVFGKVDQDRAGTPGTGHVEGLLDGLGQVVDVGHQVTVLDHRHGGADDVGFLERVGAHRRSRHLAGDRHHGHRIQEGGAQAGNQVESTRTAGGPDHTDGPAAASRVPIGGMGTALLVAHEDMLDAVRVFGQLLVQGQVGAARVAEDRVHAFTEQALEYDLGAGERPGRRHIATSGADSVVRGRGGGDLRCHPGYLPAYP